MSKALIVHGPRYGAAVADKEKPELTEKSRNRYLEEKAAKIQP